MLQKARWLWRKARDAVHNYDFLKSLLGLDVIYGRSDIRLGFIYNNLFRKRGITKVKEQTFSMILLSGDGKNPKDH